MGLVKYTKAPIHCNSGVVLGAHFSLSAGRVLRLSLALAHVHHGRVLLLLDIGNTHTHAARAGAHRIFGAVNWPTSAWHDGEMPARLVRQFGGRRINAAAMCSVVPSATQIARRELARGWKLKPFELNHKTVRGLGLDYPSPQTIGPDRLANAVAARHQYGAPSVVVDFGTAVTFDVVDNAGNYSGGIIAPGLAAMTSYLREKTALLPEIRIREIPAVIGKSTEEAMLIGAVHGYRGLIRELIQKLKRELKCRRLPVIATGGYAALMARKLPEITAVDPLLTLKGLRLAWELNRANSVKSKTHSTAEIAKRKLRE